MTIRRGMGGRFVKVIQEKLQQLSLYTGTVDSDFGGGTEGAVKRFQRNQNLPASGEVDAATWNLLFPGEQPPVSEFAAAANELRCLALTGSFETGKQPPECYCGITGDFDGQGISFGVLQWNIGQGSLQPLLAEMFESHAGVCEEVFQEHAGTVRALGSASKEEQLDFSRSIQTRVQVNEPWRGMLRALGRTSEFQQIQAKHSANNYNRALKLCEVYGLRSRRGAALMFDIVVQNGSISDIVKSQILTDFAQLPSMPPPDAEVARMRIIANRRAAASKPEFVDDVRTRKLTIANGTGTVHGIFYDLADRFCLTMDPFTL